MRVRRPGKIEIVVQVLLGILLALLGAEYISANGAGSCSEIATYDCYPWGAEGPVAGAWDYASKDMYLRAARARLLVIAMAIVAPFVVRDRWIGLGVMFFLLAFGFTQLRWLASFL